MRKFSVSLTNGARANSRALEHALIPLKHGTMLAPFPLTAHRGNAAKMAATTASLATAGPSPSHASLGGLDGVNFFIAGISAGFGPYVAAYLADQKWTPANIALGPTPRGLAGLLSQVAGGHVLLLVPSQPATR